MGPPPPHPPDIVGLLSLGMFLLTVAIVFALNPYCFSQLFSWVGTAARTSSLVRPPDALIGSTALFFGLGAVAGFLTAGLRILTAKSWWRGLRDVLSSTGVLAFAVLLTLYGNRALSGWSVLALEVGVVALLVFISVFLAAFRWRFWWMGGPGPEPGRPGPDAPRDGGDAGKY
jgi:hypothetical protein